MKLNISGIGANPVPVKARKDYPYLDEFEHQLTPGNRVTMEQRNQLASKNNLIWQEMSRFWNPALNRGKKIWDSLVGDYFTSGEIQNYESQDKILFRIPELVPKLTSLEGMQINSRRSGVVLATGASDAPTVAEINIVLKSIAHQNNLREGITTCFRNGIVSGFPQVMMFDRRYHDDMSGKDICVDPEEWESVLLDPNFLRSDGKDANYGTRIKLSTKEDLKLRYPDQAQYIEDNVRTNEVNEQIYPLYGEVFTSEERDILLKSIQDAQDNFNRTGLILSIERFHFVYKPWVCFLSPEGDFSILPPDWSEEEKYRWIQENPDHKPIRKVAKLLMVTTSTQGNMLLENRLHWMQTGELPWEVYIPKMWNKQPRGILEFLVGTAKASNVAQIEHLQSLRLANDDLVVVQEGGLQNPDIVSREKGRVGGVLVTKAGVPASEAISFPVNRREQMGWLDFSERMLLATNRLSTNPNFEGAAQSSQESGKAIDRRNRQTVNKFQPDMDTLNNFFHRIHRKILKIIPIVHKERTIYRYIDETTKQPTSVVLNEPVFDVNGIVSEIKNNLHGAKYDYIESAEDDSMTAKEHELAQFTEFINSIGNTISDPKVLSRMLIQIPNKIAQEVGLSLLKDVKAQEEAGPQPEPLKGSLSFSGEDLLHNPLVLSVLTKMGYLTPEEVQGATSLAGNLAGQPGAGEVVPFQQQSPQATVA